MEEVGFFKSERASQNLGCLGDLVPVREGATVCS